MFRMQTRAEAVGTGVFAPLNTVHVRYRGMFVELFKACPGLCKGGLKEVSVPILHLLCLNSDSQGPFDKYTLLSTCLAPHAAVSGEALRARL